MGTLIQKFVLTRLVARFLGQVPGSIQTHLNLQELARIAIATALSSGSAYEVLPTLLAQVGAFVAAPDIALVTALLTVIIEVIRRYRHGIEPAKLNLP